MPSEYFFQNLTSGGHCVNSLTDIQYYTDYILSIIITNIMMNNDWNLTDIIRVYPRDYQLPVLIFNNGNCEWSIDGKKPYIRQEFIYDDDLINSFTNTNGVA
jgi:hypothetical protein